MSKQRLDDLLAEVADEAEAGEADQTERPIPEHVKVTRGNPRSKVLQVRLNPDEMAALEAIADRRELPVSTVAREQLLRLIAADAAAGTQRAYALASDENGGGEPGEPNALPALVALLNGIGQLDELAEEVRHQVSDAQLPLVPMSGKKVQVFRFRKQASARRKLERELRHYGLRPTQKLIALVSEERTATPPAQINPQPRLPNVPTKR